MKSSFAGESDQPKAGTKEWTALAMLVIPTLLVSIDMTVTYLALPAISTALKPSSAGLLWITDIFGFMEAGLLIVMGSLGDRLGMRKVLLSGAFAFSLSSLMAAFAPSAFWLIVARGIMGIGGAAILPTVLSLIRNMFVKDSERIFAMGLYTTCFSSGTMLGPIVGGFLLNHFWWGSVFLLPVPLIAVLLVCGPFLLPEFRDTKAKPMDLVSAVLLILGILLMIYGLKQCAQEGIGVFWVTVMLSGAAILFLFIRRQGTLELPLIDLRLFSDGKFNAALAALFIGLFCWSGMFLFVGQYLQSVLGLNSFVAGMWMIPGAGGSILLCMLAPTALKYMSRGTLFTAGLLILAAGIVLLTFVNPDSLPLLVIATVGLSGGCGLTVTMGIDLVVSSAPPQKGGAAAGISETSTGFGGALGVAILGSIWTSFYRHDMQDFPNNTQAKETISAAVEAAKHLHSIEMLEYAQLAFVHALHITAWIAAAICLLAAILIALKFRK